MESKIVVIGPADVGKTCLSIRFVKDIYSSSSSSTVGASFLMKTLVSSNCSNTLRIWDTAGQEVFRSMSSLYFKGVDGAILVCDVTNPQSLHMLNTWLKDLKLHNPGRDVSICLACNKIDLIPSFDKAPYEQYGAEIGANVYFTSAKTGENIIAMFKDLSDSIIARAKPELLADTEAITAPLVPEEEPKKKSCCC